MWSRCTFIGIWASWKRRFAKTVDGVSWNYPSISCQGAPIIARMIIGAI